MTRKAKLAKLMAVALTVTVPFQAALAGDQPIKIASAQAVKGTQAVVIGAFNVGFIFESVDNGAATGGMIGAFGGTTKAKSQLIGVTPAMMQQITDAAYADMKAQLESRGFVVAEASTFFESPDFSKVKPVASPYEASIQLEKNSKGKATYFKPSAVPAQLLFIGDVPQSGFGAIGPNMAAAATQAAAAQHAKSSGRGVIDIVYLIDFSNAKRPGAFSFGGIKVSSGMSVVSGYSKMNVIGSSGKMATLTLAQPVAVEGDFAEMQDATKDAGLQKAANIMGGLAAAGGFGGLRFGKTKKFVFTAKPGPYEEGAAKAASLANTRLVDQLAALR